VSDRLLPAPELPHVRPEDGPGPRPAARRRTWRIVLPGLLVVVLVVLAVRVADRFVGGGSGSLHPLGPGGSWSKLWGDEFSGGALNTRLWQPTRSGQNSGSDAPFNREEEAAWFSSGNVAVRHGDLVFTVRRGSKTLDGTPYPLNSGLVQSRPEQVIRPGTYVEARIRVPNCGGCWPAFWAVPPDRWPPEIDVMEYFNTGTQARPEFNYHAPDESQSGPDEYGLEGTDYRGGYHVYGLYWDGAKAYPYVDGRAYPAVAATDVTTAHSLVLILNLSVKRGNQPPAGTTMSVDWVRVWEPSRG
jgi:beta-glucanase (GH16 family)